MSNVADSFDQWVVVRSFDMVGKLCKLTLLILMPFLLVADPIFFVIGYWSVNSLFYYLTIWHIVLAIGYLVIVIACKFSATHDARSWVLSIFFVFSSILFAWFAVITWFLTGDLSAYGIAMVCMASVFCFPGMLRRLLYLTTAVGISVAILVLDKKGTFLSGAVYLHLLVIATVALALDSYMMKKNRNHFDELRHNGVRPANPLAES
jgi:hypothetical protein